MPGSAHHRILEIKFTVDESDDDVESVDAVNYYRTRAQLEDSNPEALTYTAETGADPNEIEMGQLLPPASHIRLDVSTQA